MKRKYTYAFVNTSGTFYLQNMHWLPTPHVLCRAVPCCVSLHCRVTVIEAKELLGTFDGSLREYAARKLVSQGVKLRRVRPMCVFGGGGGRQVTMHTSWHEGWLLLLECFTCRSKVCLLHQIASVLSVGRSLRQTSRSRVLHIAAG